ncbi:Uncharacterised protein [Mycobacteroides abscessus subsp. massiliense]|nr:Uncharacterised protein [Mycobacteroides abscessus subsp. massiliense]
MAPCPCLGSVAVGAECRGAPGVGISHTSWRRSGRPPRVRQRSGDVGPRKSLRVHLPGQNPGLPAALYLSAFRGRGVLAAAPDSLHSARAVLDFEHHRRAVCGGSAESAAPRVRRRACGGGVDGGHDVDRTGAVHPGLRTDQRVVDAADLAGGGLFTLVDIRHIDRARRRCETDPAGQWALFPGRAPLDDRHLGRRGLSAHRGSRHRRGGGAGAVLLHRSVG